jgi:hypothetical protein
MNPDTEFGIQQRRREKPTRYNQEPVRFMMNGDIHEMPRAHKQGEEETLQHRGRPPVQG